MRYPARLQINQRSSDTQPGLIPSSSLRPAVLLDPKLHTEGNYTVPRAVENVNALLPAEVSPQIIMAAHTPKPKQTAPSRRKRHRIPSFPTHDLLRGGRIMSEGSQPSLPAEPLVPLLLR
ncbi:hypothetical protein E2C01_040273 [Portunus trituberculatus]|uniref:Uncharacterized protein n=1 Tax=Portunus trituberculatus TaxID=210409 RepID=A0A5B7FNC4_PORTR|nr:hypothetical protein [Portunus trituberculatus]